MGKYIKLFEQHSQYETYINSSSAILPNVSFCEDVPNEVHFNPWIPHDYTNDYLTFEALETGTFTFTISSNVKSTQLTSVSYSLDNGRTWTTINNVNNQTITITTPSINIGDCVLWKGTGTVTGLMANGLFNENYISRFTSTGQFNISGNIMSLLFGDNFANVTEFTSGSFANFIGLFYNNQKIIDASNLILPATTLKNSCYYYMFYGCSGLTTAPELPATTLAQYCYESMFESCRSMTKAPELHATTLEVRCYKNMFRDCTNLTTAPELPATTLASSCYEYMFRSCTSLTTAPELPAITLASSCYKYMFQFCSSLNYIKAMFTTAPSTSYTQSWVQYVASTGTFVKNSAAQWDVTGVNGIPSGWTVQTASA